MSSGQPIVLLPGMHGSADLLAPLAAALAVNRPVLPVAYPADEPLGYEELLDYVRARLPEKRFVILGESFSGPLAIEIAAREKDRVAGLILAVTFARHPFPKLLARLAPLANRRFMPRAAIRLFLLGGMAAPELRHALWVETAKITRPVLGARLRAVLTVDARQRLAETACPVLYLRGRFDRLIGAGFADEVAILRPGTRIEDFDAPHMLLETHPQEAAAAIERFCAALPH